MRYYKIINVGHLLAVGEGLGGIEITEAEYTELLSLIHNKPAAPDGYEYRITEAGEYVLVEAPVVETEYEPTVEDKAEAYDILIGEVE